MGQRRKMWQNLEKQNNMVWQDDKKVSLLRAGWPCWCFLALVVLLSVPAFIEVMPQRDVAFRYAPMAEAFRDGDFTYAFHPRTGFFHTFTAGIIAWVLQCSGFLACKLSSLLFMSLTVFPLFALMRRVYSRFMAEIVTLVFILASQLQRLGWSGLRDSHKACLIILGGYALIVIYQQREKWTGYIWLGIAVGAGFVTRGDLVLFMLLLLFWGIVMELKLKKFPLRSICSSVVAVVLALPAVILNWYLAGVAVPEIRFALIFRSLMKRYPRLEDTLPRMVLGLVALFLIAWAVRRSYDAGFGKYLGWSAAGIWLALLVWRCCSADFQITVPVSNYLGSIIRGFFPVYAVTGLFGIGFRLLKKHWTREESILAAMLFGHAILVCSQVIFHDKTFYVSSRYLMPAIPLELGWSVIGILGLWEILTCWVRDKHPRLVHNVGSIAFALTVCGFLYDFYLPIINRKPWNYPEQLRMIAKTIQKDYKGPAEFRPEVDPGHYIPKLKPAILFVSGRKKKFKIQPDFSKVIISAYFAKGRVAYNLAEADYVVDNYAKRNYFPAGTVLLREVKFGKKKYRIWKKIK